MLLMLTLMLLQFVTGLMTSDDILTEGPLVALVPSAWVGIASVIHQWNINVILALMAVHIVAAIWHQWRGDKVITAMVTGNKLSAEKAEFKFRAVGLYLLLVLIIGGAFYLWQGDVVLDMLRSEWA